MGKLKKFTIFAGDLMLLYGALSLTLLLRYGTGDFSLRLDAHLVPFSLIFILWIMVFYLFNLYQYKTSKTENVLKNVSLAVSVSVLLSITAFYFLPDFFQLTPKINMIIFGVIMLALKYGWQNLALFGLFTTGLEKIIIVGNSPLISETALYLKDSPQAGYLIEAWFDDPRVVGFEKISETIKSADARLIVVQEHLTKDSKVSNLIYNLLAHQVNVISFGSFYEAVFEQVPIEELGEGWFIENISSHRPFYDLVKRVVDIVFSLIMIVILSPFMILSAILIRISSSGPAIFKQDRMGQNERSFMLYKFRTMKDGVNGPLWTTKDDERITPVGKFLRKTHIDEFPQLFNMLRGDISLIGPRPERTELARKYSELPYYDIRHIIKPGLTGWAQVKYRPSASLEEAKKKLCYDMYYIKNRSIFLDFIIMVRTIRYLFVSNR